MPELSIDQKLQQQRDLIEAKLAELQGFYQQQPAQDLWGQIQGRASGANVPYTQQVQQSMWTDNAKAANAGWNNSREMIQQAFSNAGLGGSGLAASAMLTSRRAADAAVRAGRREITSTAQLQNYQAQERAQQQAQQYLAQQQAAQFATGQEEIRYREQMQATTQKQQQDAAAQALAAKYSGANPFLAKMGMLGGVTYQSGRVGGFSGGFGNNMIGWYGHADSAQQAYANKKDTLQQQADDWNMRRDQALMGYGA